MAFLAIQIVDKILVEPLPVFLFGGQLPGPELYDRPDPNGFPSGSGLQGFEIGEVFEQIGIVMDRSRADSFAVGLKSFSGSGFGDEVFNDRN